MIASQRVSLCDRIHLRFANIIKEVEINALLVGRCAVHVAGFSFHGWTAAARSSRSNLDGVQNSYYIEKQHN